MFILMFIWIVPLGYLKHSLLCMLNEIFRFCSAYVHVPCTCTCMHTVYMYMEIVHLHVHVIGLYMNVCVITLSLFASTAYVLY